MRIVQVANFVTPTSGGLRTAMGHLAQGYAGSGHEVVQVVPGDADGECRTSWGTRVTLRAPRLGATGYRVLADLPAVRRAVGRHAPDALEVHDRTTLRGLGGWARARGVPSLVVSHERLDRWLAQWLPGRRWLTVLADRSNTRLAEGFDAVVCTTPWAAEEFARLGTPRLEVIPLAVDLSTFPGRTQPRAAGADGRGRVGTRQV